MLYTIKKEAVNIIKIGLVFTALSAAFSLVGILLPERGPIANPTPGFNLHEISGHILWGLLAGAVTLSFRYTILTGLFAILIDSDHVIGLTHIEALSRMSHSIFFGIIAVIVLMTLFGKRDYLLGSAVIAGLLSHLSFDIFSADDGKFPIFTPFYNHQISFPNETWIYFEIAAVISIGIAMMFSSKKKLKVTS